MNQQTFLHTITIGGCFWPWVSGVTTGSISFFISSSSFGYRMSAFLGGMTATGAHPESQVTITRQVTNCHSASHKLILGKSLTVTRQVTNCHPTHHKLILGKSLTVTRQVTNYHSASHKLSLGKSQTDTRQVTNCHSASH